MVTKDRLDTYFRTQTEQNKEYQALKVDLLDQAIEVLDWMHENLGKNIWCHWSKSFLYIDTLNFTYLVLREKDDYYKGYIKITIEQLYSDEWKVKALEKYKVICAKDKEKAEKKRKKQEEKERAEYERLKAKFERGE